MQSNTEENYLKALFQLANGKDEVSVAELSKRLGTKMPTVNSMMKKLAEKKLVRYKSYKPLRLTTKGKKEAALIIRKHRLTEMFLVEKMGFGWEVVHDIAEQVEHIKSPLFFEKMDEILGHPKLDPHGEPIPDEKGIIKDKNGYKLSECKAGETVEFSGVSNSSNELLSFLNDHKLSLGMTIKIKSIELFDGSMVISYGNRNSETFSHTVCERLLVKKTHS